MNTHPIEAILFDMDGVIIDTHAAVTAFWFDLATRYAVSLTEEDFARHVYGCTADHTLDTLFPMITTTERSILYREIEDYERNQTYHAMPGALDLLRQLQAHGIPTALVTSGARWKVETVSAQLGLDGLFTTVVTSDMIQHSKPHPQGYQTAAARLGRPAHHCVVFEDAVSGIQAGCAAGARCIGVSAHQDNELRDAGAWCVVPTLAGVRVTIGANHGAVLEAAGAFRLPLVTSA